MKSEKEISTISHSYAKNEVSFLQEEREKAGRKNDIATDFLYSTLLSKAYEDGYIQAQNDLFPESKQEG